MEKENFVSTHALLILILGIRVNKLNAGISLIPSPPSALACVGLGAQQFLAKLMQLPLS